MFGMHFVQGPDVRPSMLVSPTWEPMHEGCLKLEVQCPSCESGRLCLDVILFQGNATNTLELECLENLTSADLMVNVSNGHTRFGVKVMSPALNDSTDAMISSVNLFTDSLCLEPLGIFVWLVLYCCRSKQ